jgi:hypothetical protein
LGISSYYIGPKFLAKWGVSAGLRISCKHELDLSNGKSYKVLTELIEEEKSLHYSKQILETTSKIKAVLKSVKKKTIQKKTPSVSVNENVIKIINSQQTLDILTS